MRYLKKTIRDLDLDGKTVIVRLDLNVPIKDGIIQDQTRIVQSLPTLEYLVSKNCKIIVLSHLGRIKSLEDKQSNKKSLAPIAKALQELLPNQQVSFLPVNVGDEVVKAVERLKPKQILVLENTRYQDVNDQGEVVKKESKNNQELGAFWASLADVFVNDAFGTAHRAHASNVGIANKIKDSAIGFLIERELKNLYRACDKAEHPIVAVMGGAKVSDKLEILTKLVKNVDYVLIGGGMAHTFVKASGQSVGKSLVQEDMVETCKELLEKYPNKIVLPVDGYGVDVFEDKMGVYLEDRNNEVFKNLMCIDIGEKTVELFSHYLEKAKTILWNGPMGVFEFSNFQYGTKAIAQKIAEVTQKNHAFSLIGGGDSASAINLFNLSDQVSFISTGGGASLTYIEGAPLPGIESIVDLKK